MPADAVIREVRPGSAEYRAAVELRDAVLRKPLGLEFSPEEIADEPNCLHLVAMTDDTVLATLLLKPLDAQTVKMRQVAVRPDLQGSGIGRQLIAFAEDLARNRGWRRIIAHARGTATGFYTRLGYTTEGEPFLENTIPHILVTKTLVYER